MAWVQADEVEGGGTEFPLLQREAPDYPWCQWVECTKLAERAAELSHADEGLVTGVIFKPVAGNAVYWENFRPDGTGRGWDETWHAGLPGTYMTWLLSFSLLSPFPFLFNPNPHIQFVLPLIK